MQLDYEITGNGVADLERTTSQYVPIGEAAKFLKLSVDTVRRWEKSGKLKSLRLDGKNRYFLITDLEAHTLERPLSTKGAAAMLGVSESTVRRLEHRQLLIPERDKHGRRQYSRSNLDAYLARKAALAVSPQPATVAHKKVRTLPTIEPSQSETIRAKTALLAPSLVTRLKQNLQMKVAAFKQRLRENSPAQPYNYLPSASMLFLLLLICLPYVTTSLPNQLMSTINNVPMYVSTLNRNQLPQSLVVTLPNKLFLQQPDSRLWQPKLMR